MVQHVNDKLLAKMGASAPPSRRQSVDTANANGDHSQHQEPEGLTSRRPSSDIRGANGGPKSEELYEILCNDIVLPLDMTLIAVRQYVWRSGSELALCYRRKK